MKRQWGGIYAIIRVGLDTIPALGDLGSPANSNDYNCFIQPENRIRRKAFFDAISHFFESALDHLMITILTLIFIAALVSICCGALAIIPLKKLQTNMGLSG